MAHYIFNLAGGDASRATEFLRAKMWGVGAEEAHGVALAPGDLILVYLAAPARKFIARAELASAVHDWTPPEAQVYPGDLTSGVLLAQVEEWDPPVPMSTVLAQIGQAGPEPTSKPVSYVSPLTSMRPRSRWQSGTPTRPADP
ncbi:MAG TPA: hypothetical protein VGH82_13510 [Gaiellaceae bacterium]